MSDGGIRNPEAAEGSSSPEKRKKLVLRSLAGAALAASSFFGATFNKAGDEGVGAATSVEVFNPLTGNSVGVIVGVANKPDAMGLGLTEDFWNNVDRSERGRGFLIQVGDASFSVETHKMKDGSPVLAIKSGVGKYPK